MHLDPRPALNRPLRSSPTQTALPVADFGGQIRLLAWSSTHHNDTLTVSLTWQAQTYPDKDYTAYVHVLDSAGNLLTQLDRPPAGYPTSDWQPGEVVYDTYSIPFPPDTSAAVILETGFYYLPTLEPLGLPIRLAP